MSCLESKDYQEARDRMFNERIVRDMAVGLRGVDLDTLTHDDGTPTFHFMTGAGNEYMARGGTNPAHIGCVAETLLALRKAGIDSLNPEGS